MIVRISQIPAGRAHEGAR